ncbi:MAG TPA: hypothetical protein VF898_03390 [Chloroflexota bacterium]
MGAGFFDLAAFYAEVGALPKEHAALRQNLVRGLKDFFRSIYGYDRYGAETIFLLHDHMNLAHAYGYGAVRIVRDRRIGHPTRVASAARALSLIDYGSDSGTPYGLTTLLLYLARQDRLPVEHLRLGLIACAGHPRPFEAMDKTEMAEFATMVANHEAIPATEKLFWMHSVICHHGDRPGAGELINVTLGSDTTSPEDRIELCRAWLHSRQPRLTVEIPDDQEDPHATFVADRLRFWVAHMPSRPGGRVVQLALIWLVRLSGQCEQVIDEFQAFNGPHAEQLRSAIADVLLEHHATMAPDLIIGTVDQGILNSTSGATRRKFYRVGMTLLGPEYLKRASSDTSGSVRQWAVRELTKPSQDRQAVHL